MNICDPSWDLVPLGGNAYFLVDELYFLVAKSIRKYSYCNLAEICLSKVTDVARFQNFLICIYQLFAL